MAAKLSVDDARASSKSDMEAFNEHVSSLQSEGGEEEYREPGAPREVTIGDPVEPVREEPDDAPSEPSRSRRERKAARFSELEAEKIRLETENRLYREQLEQQRQQPAVQYQPPQQTGPDPFAVAEAKLQKEYQELHEVYALKSQSGALTPQEQESFRQRGWELNKKVQQLSAAQLLQRAGLTPEALQRLRQQPQQVDSQVEVTQAMLKQEFRDVYADPNLVRRAQLAFDNLVLDGMDPNDIQTGRRALENTRRQYGTPQRPAPGRSERQQLSSLPARGGGGGRENGSGGGGGSVKMTPELRKMATRAFPNLPADQAIQKWANMAGPGFNEDERRYGR
jgi:hypothetical protein